MTKLQKKLNSLAYRFACANSCRKRVEKLYAAKKLTKTDVEHIYKGLFINSVVDFENFVEELFIGLLLGKFVVRGVQPQIDVRDAVVAKSMLARGTNKYIDWLPFERTLERANIFFKGSRPFNKVSKSDCRNIGFMIKIRNYFAHGSEVSKEAYIKHLSSVYAAYPASHINPLSYLRDYYSYQTKTSYYEQLFANIWGIARSFTVP